MTTAQAIATAAVTALFESARRHKHAEAAHRRAAREDMQARDRLLRECAAAGIHVELVAPRHSPKEAETHGTPRPD